ncbi:MAG: CPBP family intramembrane metalloprotease [Clostridia bacterium]|nr:CPBP family intramembrane metalloprotease [Clostridia bacterium]
MDKDIRIKKGLFVIMTAQLIFLITIFCEIKKMLGDVNVDKLGFSIFIMVILYFILLCDKVKYTKKYFLTGNVILFLLIPLVVFRILTIINILLLIFVKQEKREKLNFKEAVKQLSVEKKSTNIKQWILMLILLVIYFGQNFIKAEWLETLSPIMLLIYAIGLHVVLMALAIWTFFDEIKEGTKKIAKNFRLTGRYMLKLLVWMLIALAIATAVSTLITRKSQSVNQQTIESLPLYITIPLAVIWAPFVEETVFRGTFKKIIKHKLLFIIISGSVFGIMHALGEATLVIALATALPYAALGMAFAYSYARTNNLAINILFHLLYNSIAVLVSTLK